jgi:hypothetical protein
MNRSKRIKYKLRANEVGNVRLASLKRRKGDLVAPCSLLIAINGSLTLKQANISFFYTMSYMKNIMSSAHKRFFDEFQGFFGLDN